MAKQKINHPEVFLAHVFRDLRPFGKRTPDTGLSVLKRES